MKPEKSKLINFSKDDIQKTIIVISKNFDRDNGGLGGAPKFPNEPVMRFLIDQNSEAGGSLLNLKLEINVVNMLNFKF